MGKYVLAYTGGGTPESEEEGQRVMAAWQDWLGGIGDAVVDWGAPFGASAAVNGGTLSGLTGYSIVTAEGIDEAVGMAASCPIFTSGGGVEVYEAMEM
jgi:hypothetical protein